MGERKDEAVAANAGPFAGVSVKAAPRQRHGVEGDEDERGEKGHDYPGRYGFNGHRDGSGEEPEGHGVKDHAQAPPEGLQFHVGPVFRAKAGESRETLPQGQLELEYQRDYSGNDAA